MSDSHPVSLRPAGPTDAEFLYRVYADSRAQELALAVAWSAAQRDGFLRLQFEAQRAHYHQHYPDARYDLILRHGEPVGRLYVCRLADEIRLMDIALLATARGQGIGTGLLRGLLREADRVGLPVGLHVEEHNPAQRLYQRLGFTVIGEVPFYQRMRREPHRPRAEPEPGAAPIPWRTGAAQANTAS
jgi:ribosomal protein S18 acetylase RimI-like enzyme